MQALNLRSRYWQAGILGVSALGYFFMAYFIPRHNTAALLTIYTLLFGGYLLLIRSGFRGRSLNMMLASAIAFRLLFIVAFPALSDDIYRFVWDGRLLANNLHPFAQLPAYYLQAGNTADGLTAELFGKLNSPDYYTIYPPFAQFVFWLSALVSESVSGSAIFIRVAILLSEVGTLFMLGRLLENYGLPKDRSLLYALNPLIIIELTGNLHFEAFMIFFLLLAIYCLHYNALTKAALFMSLSIAGKLLPLMLLPLFLRRLKTRPLVIFYGLTALFSLLFFLPLFDRQFLSGMRESMGLYFQKFEFNASIYYLVREVGFWVKGYNIIGTAGKYLAVFTMLFIFMVSTVRRPKHPVFHAILCIFTIYLFMATTVHPWYLATLVAVSAFTPYRYGILWSFLIFFTYAGYTAGGFRENYFVVVAEYVLTGAFILYELSVVTGRRVDEPAGLTAKK